MITKIFKKIAGDQYSKFVKKAQPIVAQINAYEEEYQSLSDDQLKAKTAEFKQRYRDAMEAFEKGFPGVDPEKSITARLAETKGGYHYDTEIPRDDYVTACNEALDALLPEAFAAAKNCARRLCGKKVEVCDHELLWEMVHYDVQLIGGMSLHKNKVAEMATGEGKTLVATLPLYLNALTGRNCQLVTVNDYLARRDSEWMGHLYRWMGLTVGCLQGGQTQTPDIKREMYQCDITYGTASEFGFDYLRDNGMSMSKDHQVQRDHYFCIVDEVDSILIDEARTPLIISGPAQVEREMPFGEYKPQVQRLVKKQTNFCSDLVNAARKALEADGVDPDGPYDDEVLADLYVVKQGNPKNKILLRLMERGAFRKAFEKFELEMHGDFNKERRYALKERLYYALDEKGHSADLTENGRTFLRPGKEEVFLLPDLPAEYMEIEKLPGLSQTERDEKKTLAQRAFEEASERIHCIGQLLRAFTMYEKDVEYVVENGKVVIVDENTGRKMVGRRWGDGLHAAVEAKEGVTIEKETKTYATITIQNHFRLYDKLAGMTGTAETEANEFRDIYNLDVMVVPTNKPCLRKDENDIIYKTRREKYNAAVEEIEVAHRRGQPVLVGTVSVDSSEVLSRLLKRKNIPHAVLNAKFHEQEAEIVSRAGHRGSVTIATNMAGRGTDIKLGEGVKDLGGLYVLGTERHTSRRIDRQLRGRCARQGDPGYTRFFLSLEDDLMRLYNKSSFASKILEGAFEEGQPLEASLLNRAIEKAQKTVEQMHYTTRKRLLQYDDVLNQQREVIYGIRNDAIHSSKPRELIFELVAEELEHRILEGGITGEKEEDPTAREELVGWINTSFPVALKLEEIADISPEEITTLVTEKARKACEIREANLPPEAADALERFVIINSIDRHWQDHLTEMEELRQAVGIRSYGQKDPLQEYKNEAYYYFDEMMSRVRSATASGLFQYRINVTSASDRAAQRAQAARQQGPAEAGNEAAPKTATASRTGKNGSPGPKSAPALPPRPATPEIGRNATVTIKRGNETKQLKFKKAQRMIEQEGWTLVNGGKS